MRRKWDAKTSSNFNSITILPFYQNEQDVDEDTMNVSTLRTNRVINEDEISTEIQKENI